MSSDTIYALSSAAGRAAVALVRVSGPQVPDILNQMAGGLPAARRASRRNIRRPGTDEVIDDGLVLFFPGPASATGEDLTEFHIHGGRAVQHVLFECLSAFPRCRPAEPGEFSQRGFENGKLDLTAAEGVADLVDAETEAQRRQAQRQASGELAQRYDDWREQIIQAQALIEADIDFSDEGDVDDAVYRASRGRVEKLAEEIEQHLQSASRGEIIRSGYRVVIAGPTNAGKSSLLNALAKRDVAIVSDQAGTTRDVIEVHLDLAGYPVIVSDTAGMRETSDDVEKEGIRRTLDRAADADLVIWLRDISASDDLATPPRDARRIIKVLNKCDLRSGSDQSTDSDALQTSVKTGAGIPELIDRLSAIIQEDLDTKGEAIPTNSRHRHYLAQASQHLSSFLAADSEHPELRAEDLRLAATALGRLTGRIDVEDILDQIFSRFCIGK